MPRFASSRGRVSRRQLVLRKLHARVLLCITAAATRAEPRDLRWRLNSQSTSRIVPIPRTRLISSLRGGRAQGFNLFHSPDDVVFGYGAIDFIPLPPSRDSNQFQFFSGTVTINVIANDGIPFDGVLTLYPRFNSSDVVATGTSLGAGETFLQFDGGSSYSNSGYSLELQDNGNDQTGGYTIFVNVPGGPLYTPTGGNDT